MKKSNSIKKPNSTNKSNPAEKPDSAKNPYPPEKKNFNPSGKIKTVPAKKPKPEDNIPLNGLKFLAIFLILFLPSYFILSPISELNDFAAISSQFFLKTFFGTDSQILPNHPFPLLKTEKLVAEISDLCSAKIEIALMFALIFASFEKKLPYRFKGFLGGLLFLLFFNALRISTTIYFFNANNLAASALFHDILFRISIVIAIVTYYAIWYYYRKK